PVQDVIALVKKFLSDYKDFKGEEFPSRMGFTGLMDMGLPSGIHETATGPFGIDKQRGFVCNTSEEGWQYFEALFIQTELPKMQKLVQECLESVDLPFETFAEVRKMQAEYDYAHRTNRGVHQRTLEHSESSRFLFMPRSEGWENENYAKLISPLSLNTLIYSWKADIISMIRRNFSSTCAHQSLEAMLVQARLVHYLTQFVFHTMGHVCSGRAVLSSRRVCFGFGEPQSAEPPSEEALRAFLLSPWEELRENPRNTYFSGRVQIITANGTPRNFRPDTAQATQSLSALCTKIRVIDAHQCSIVDAKDWGKAKQVHEEEIAELPPKLQKTVDKAAYTLRFPKRQAWKSHTAVRDFLFSENPRPLEFTGARAHKFLRVVKAYELLALELNARRKQPITFRRNPFEPRLRAFKTSGDLGLMQAMTRTLMEEKLEDARYRRNLENWTDAMSVALIQAERLFNENSAPSLLKRRIVVGGAPCSGKSHYIRSLQETTGMAVLDMDSFLPLLMNALPEGHELRNLDLHEFAGRVLFARAFDDLTFERQSGHILTQCLDSVEKVRRSVIGPAEKMEFETCYDDLYCSLTTALLRLLTREASGRDPLTPLDEVLKRYTSYRTSRRQVIEEVLASRWVTSYALMKNDLLVASKEEGRLTIHDPRRFEKLLSARVDTAAALQKVITPELIARKRVLKEPLYRWVGSTLGDALQAKFQESAF
ncbi:MAG: hypothetical protein KDK48_05675, partial [Chlamydiia bacterium]|nr:hypothetical protein [Chlamydiia bacterium]